MCDLNAGFTRRRTVHQFGSSVGGEPEETLTRRHSGAIVSFERYDQASLPTWTHPTIARTTRKRRRMVSRHYEC